MMNSLSGRIFLFFVLILFFISLMELNLIRKSDFNAENAFRVLAKLQSNGPRTPTSFSHDYSIQYISNQLNKNGWNVKVMSGTIQNHPVQNIIATRNENNISTILASHYDSRMVANKDPNPNLREFPVPGANDGGSSCAILLELARILKPSESSDIALVFFDAEDQGNLPGWDWILGSRLFVQQMEKSPSRMILLDMVGGFDQQIVPPVNSDKKIYQDIRSVAESLGYSDNFLESSNKGILDDHVPFYEAGVPAVDLIDIIDPRWHTTSDDIENVSLPSLQRVGDTLYFWILAQK
jgi:glutaminyl-peptide cyclotransferase